MKKFIKENWLKILIVVVVIVFVSVLSTSKFGVQTKNTTGTKIANPATVNCIEKGGNHSIVEGQIGMCTLRDGTVCEEWAYFRGEC